MFNLNLEKKHKKTYYILLVNYILVIRPIFLIYYVVFLQFRPNILFERYSQPLIRYTLHN